MTLSTRQILLLAACGFLLGCERAPAGMVDEQRATPSFSTAAAPSAGHAVHRSIHHATRLPVRTSTAVAAEPFPG